MGSRENNPFDNLTADARTAAAGLLEATSSSAKPAKTTTEMPEILVDMTEEAKATLEKGDVKGWNKAKMEKELDHSGFKVTIKVDNLNLIRLNLSKAPALDLDNCLLQDPKISESTFSAISLNNSRIAELQTAYITNNRIEEIGIRGLKIETAHPDPNDIRGSVRFSQNKYAYVEHDGTIPVEMQKDIKAGYMAPAASTYNFEQGEKETKAKFDRLIALKEDRNDAWHEWDKKSGLEKGIIKAGKNIAEAVKDFTQGGPGSDGANHNTGMFAITPCTFNGKCGPGR